MAVAPGATCGEARLNLPRRIAFRSAADRAGNAPLVADHLRRNGLIAYPTETVYGFGCALRGEALDALAELKSREERKPFLILAGDISQLRGLRWTPAARALAAAFWPGALTLALEVEGGVYPPSIVSAEGTVAARISPHEAVRAILGALGEPITSTSANRAGEPPAHSAAEASAVVTALGAADQVWIVDGGELPSSAPSTLVDCSREPPRVLRAGALPLTALRSVVPEIDERR